MMNLFDYFVENHNLHLTEGELEDIRCAVRADILPPKTALHAEQAGDAIQNLWAVAPCARNCTDSKAIKAAVETLLEITGMEVPNG